MKTRIIAILLFFMYSFTGNSQSIEDGCSDVLYLASKDVSSESYKANTAKYLYDKYCQSISSNSGFNLSVTDEDLLESFSLGFGSHKENMSSLCKLYESKYQQIVETDRKSSFVVRDAIKAWLECKRLSQNGVKVSPKVQNTQFAIDFARIGDDVNINGAIYDSNACTCKGFSDNTFGVTNYKVFKDDTRHSIEDGKIWTLTCIRTATIEAGATIYPEVDISIPTSEGTFSMTIPRNVKPNYVWLQDVVLKLDQLEKTQKQESQKLQSNINNVNSRFGKIRFMKKCVRRESTCGIEPPDSAIQDPGNGWIYTGISEYNTQSGGRCGVGDVCRVYWKVIP